MSTETDRILDLIRRHHRRRRFAMKTQQKVVLSLESYIRRNATDWHPDMDDKARAIIKKKVQEVIKDARENPENEFHKAVFVSDRASEPSMGLRALDEKEMTTLAKQLPVYPWVEATKGAGALGLATIMAEAGHFFSETLPDGRKATICKLWKRLGYAPYDGLAGSTWKRESWRPRALTKEEWIENPFSGERYAFMHQIASWLWVKQWIGKGKTEDGVGKPNGHYGQIYFDRRQRMKIVHPDWTDGHSHSDALRIMMKDFLRDLWLEWRRLDHASAEPFSEAAE